MRKEMTIKDTAGLHASLAAKLVQLASTYDVEVRLEYADKMVDAKSILGLMSLAVPSGQNVAVIAEGSDAQKAIDEIEKLFG